MIFSVDGATATLLGWTFPAYPMLVVGTAILGSGLLAFGVRSSWGWSRAADSMLVAAALALIFARAEHVALNWEYFSQAREEILSLASGGLDWHGAVAGAALGGWISARVFQRDFDLWLGAAAFALPLIAFGAWWGCAAVSCAYGQEVVNLSDYPSWQVWEARGDFLMLAPRYAVQPMGMAASAVELIVGAAGTVLGISGRRRAGLTLLFVALSAFALGFLRGDTAVRWGSLRGDQWLDLAAITAAVMMLSWPRRRRVNSA